MSPAGGAAEPLSRLRGWRKSGGMNEQPPPRFRLNRTRIFLIAMVVVALGLAAMTIVSSLSVWQERDAQAPETDSQPES